MNDVEQHVKFVAADLSDGFSYELDEYGDYRTEDGEPTSPWEYLADALDFEFTVDSDGELRHARIMVTCGGPNIWVDTEGFVEGYWWGEEARAYYPSSVADELLDAVQEYYACTR